MTFRDVGLCGWSAQAKPPSWQYQEVMADPIAAKYVRPYMGSEEALHDKPRWCLWLTELDSADLQRSNILADRVSAVRQFRLESTASSTRQMARTPHLFGQRPAPRTVPYIVIPSVCSEKRPFFAVRRVPANVIASNLVFTATDPTSFLLGMISSSMFMTWQSTVGGRLESRLRFSNTIVWNNLPLPKVTPKMRQQIIDAAESLQLARDASGMSLAKMYEPGALTAELIKAHADVDHAVDRAFGATQTCTTELDRQTVLFARFLEMVPGTRH